MYRFIVVLLGLTAFLFCDAVLAKTDNLTIGDKAPSLNVEHWVQTGKGRFKPVTDFKSGKIYVVEFWSTSCVPCILSMPHIVETQDKYADKGVQIVSISHESLETVKEFLEREVPEFMLTKPASHSDDHPGDENVQKKADFTTFNELTSNYCLTTDPDRSVHKSYMTAAGLIQIPMAFLVGKTGQIEWIGLPKEMDEPIAQVVADKWDREAFKKKFTAGDNLNQMVAKLAPLARDKKYKELKDLATEILEIAEPNTMAYMQAALRLEFARFGLATLEEINHDLDKLLNAKPLNTGEIMDFADMIISAKLDGDEKLDKVIVEKSIDAMQTVIDSMGENTDPMDKALNLQVYAHALFSLGMKEKARDIATLAIKFSPKQQKANFEKALAPILESGSKDDQ